MGEGWVVGGMRATGRGSSGRSRGAAPHLCVVASVCHALPLVQAHELRREVLGRAAHVRQDGGGLLLCSPTLPCADRAKPGVVEGA